MKIKAYLVIEKVEYENYVHCFSIAKDQDGYFSKSKISVGLKQEVLTNESGSWSLSLEESQ